MTPHEHEWFTQCLKSAPRATCELMWSPATRPSEWDVFAAWMRLHGFDTLLVVIFLAAGLLGWIRWKFR